MEDNNRKPILRVILGIIIIIILFLLGSCIFRNGIPGSKKDNSINVVEALDNETRPPLSYSEDEQTTAFEPVLQGEGDITYTLISATSEKDIYVDYFALKDDKSTEVTVAPKTPAGVYRLLIRVNASGDDETLAGSKEFTIYLTINKAEPSYEDPKAIDDLVYNGKDQQLINPGLTSNGTFMYRLEDGEYSKDLPVGNKPGTYTVYYKVAGDENHTDSAEKSFKVTIKDPSANKKPSNTNKADSSSSTPSSGGGSSDPELIRVNKPVATSIIKTYNGSAQNNEYNKPDHVSVSGVSEARDAGVYEAVYTPDNGYIWTDGTSSPIKVTLTINKAKLTAPTIKQSSFTYDGTDKEVSFNGFDSNTMKLSGDTSKVNAGSYKAIISIKDKKNYTWQDGTDTDLSYDWTIDRIVVKKPSLDDSVTLIYNGKKQSPVIKDYDDEIMYYFGASGEVNAGEYPGTINLKDRDNYVWEDGTDIGIPITWRIEKATTTIPEVQDKFVYVPFYLQSVRLRDLVEGTYSPNLVHIVESEEHMLAGEGYKVTVGLNDSRNYKWTDGTSENKTLVWRIKKAENPLTFVATQNLSSEYSRSNEYERITEANYAVGDLSYELISQTDSDGNPTDYFTLTDSYGRKYIKINGYTPAGVYTLKVAATAEGNRNYESATKESVITLTINPYTVRVRFVAGSGAKVVPSSKYVNLDEAYGTLPVPSREGYEFVGWYETPSYRESEKVDADTVVKFRYNHDLYAKWNALDSAYTVKHWIENLDNDKYTLTQTDAKTGKSGYNVNFASLSKEFEGFTYYGGSTRGSETRPSDWYFSKYAEIKADGSLVINLYYTRDTYTVSFDSNGGTRVSDMKVKANAAIGTLPLPFRDGYMFEGWYTEAEEGALVTEQTIIGADATFYAHWKENAKATFTVNHYVRSNDYSVAFRIHDLFNKDVREIPYGQTVFIADYAIKDNPLLEMTRTRRGDNSISPLYSDTTVQIKEDGSTVVSIYYSTEDFLVTFDPGEGILPLKEREKLVNYGAKYGKLPEPAREGYTFEGWFKDEELTQEITSDTTMLDSNDHTLYAKWNANKYVVTFDGNGGIPEIETLEQTYDDNYKLSDEIGRTGYTFEGWYTDPTEGEHITVADLYKTAGDQTLYAHWLINKYTVTFDSNGGSEVEKQLVEYMNKVAVPEAPTKEGYTFDGWYIGDKSFDFNTEVTDNITLTAHWMANDYKVEFNKNHDDASGSMDDQSFKYDEEKALTENAFTREGYNFVGWNTEKDGTGTSYENKATVKNLTSKHNDTVKLYAQWEIKTFTVTFDTDGGSEVASQTVEYKDKVDGNIEAPTKEGYHFAGWYLGENPYNFNTEVTEDITIKAHWTANTYTIDFKRNSSDASGNTADQTFNYDEEKPLNNNGFVRNDYDFVEWNTKEDGTGVAYANGATVKNLTSVDDAVVRLYAQWKKKTYTVTFNSDGGSEVASQTVEKGGKATKPADPTREGYSFVAWQLNGKNYDFSKKVTGNIELVAKWAPVSQKIIDTTVNYSSVQGSDEKDRSYSLTNLLGDRASDVESYSIKYLKNNSGEKEPFKIEKGNLIAKKEKGKVGSYVIEVTVKTKDGSSYKNGTIIFNWEVTKSRNTNSMMMSATAPVEDTVTEIVETEETIVSEEIVKNETDEQIVAEPVTGETSEEEEKKEETVNNEVVAVKKEEEPESEEITIEDLDELADDSTVITFERKDEESGAVVEDTEAE